MKIGIHNSAWDGFSHDWIEYCQKAQISYKLVDCYKSDIIDQLKGCWGLMWHFHHSISEDSIFAKQLLFAVEQAGIKVFPNFRTAWHFDDKLGQKYLLEAVGAPMAPTYVFYSEKEAYNWVKTTTFPKVFKLRGGAGSSNVKLVKSKRHAKQLIRKAFSIGFPTYNKWGNLKDQIQKLPSGKTTRLELLKSIRRLFVSTKFAKVRGPERGYVLFQEFLPDNTYDIRVVTIGHRAFAIKRLVRKNDFRASGSGYIHYNKHEIDEACIRTAFEITRKLGAQCVAYDFVYSIDRKPLIVEINYGFAHRAYFDCPGYWDEDLNWYEEKFNSAEWMIELLINEKSMNDSCY